jgi:hypothetical protein
MQDGRDTSVIHATVRGARGWQRAGPIVGTATSQLTGAASISCPGPWIEGQEHDPRSTRDTGETSDNAKR